LIADLARQADEHRNCETDVVIVGAGIAGLVLATRLRRSGIRVAVLESGGREQAADTHPLNRTVQLGAAYSGASHGRFRCLGGTSTRWGGALIPFMEHDLAARPYLGLPGFPIGIASLQPHLAEAEDLFGLNGGSYEEEFVRQIGVTKFVPTSDPEFNVRFAKWPPFKKRNVATLFKSSVERDQGLEIWINSTATKFDVNAANGRIVSVTGSSEGYKSISIAAKHVVICAGAIESTRLLLLLDRQHGNKIFSDCNALGRFFNDHISMSVAKIRAKQIVRLNRMAGFRFVGSAMRSLRFELSAAAQEQACVGSAFGHISFKTENETGFDALRNLLRSLQRSKNIPLGPLAAAFRDVPYLAKMALWRLIYRQLLWPVPAAYELHVVAEQLPRADNYITLASENDCFGLPLAAVRWQIERQDVTTFAVFKRRFDGFWNKHGLRDIGELEWTVDPEGAIGRLENADVYHPGGSTRMGTDRREAVVDANLRCFGVTNLWVASTSTFPSGGGENPTLMLILFTMRLADHLSRHLYT
jgi:choline dehydrogenase-like flavoprotein